MADDVKKEPETITLTKEELNKLIDKKIIENNQATHESFDDLFNKKIKVFHQDKYGVDVLQPKLTLHATNNGSGYSLDDYRRVKGNEFILNGENIISNTKK